MGEAVVAGDAEEVGNDTLDAKQARTEAPGEAQTQAIEPVEQSFPSTLMQQVTGSRIEEVQQQARMEGAIDKQLAIITSCSETKISEFLAVSHRLESLLPNEKEPFDDDVKAALAEVHAEIEASQNLIADFLKDLITIRMKFMQTGAILQGAVKSLQDGCRVDCVFVSEGACRELRRMEEMIKELLVFLNEMRRKYDAATKSNQGSKARALRIKVAGLDQRNEQEVREMLQARDRFRDCKKNIVQLKKNIDLVELNSRALHDDLERNSKETLRLQKVIEDLVQGKSEVNAAKRDKSKQAFQLCMQNVLQSQHERVDQDNKVRDEYFRDLKAYKEKRLKLLQELQEVEASAGGAPLVPGFGGCRVYIAADVTPSSFTQWKGQHAALENLLSFQEGFVERFKGAHPEATLDVALTAFKKDVETPFLSGSWDDVNNYLRDLWHDRKAWWGDNETDLLGALRACRDNIRDSVKSRTHVILVLYTAKGLRNENVEQMDDMAQIGQEMAGIVTERGSIFTGVVQAMKPNLSAKKYNKLVCALNGGRAVFENSPLFLTSDSPAHIVKHLGGELGGRKARDVLVSDGAAKRGEAESLIGSQREMETILEKQLELLRSKDTAAEDDLARSCVSAMAVFEQQIEQTKSLLEDQKEVRKSIEEEVRILTVEDSSLKANLATEEDDHAALAKNGASSCEPVVREGAAEGNALQPILGKEGMGAIVQSSTEFVDNAHRFNLMVMGVIETGEAACVIVSHRISQILHGVSSVPSDQKAEEKVARVLFAYSQQIGLMLQAAGSTEDWRRVVKFHCPDAPEARIQAFTVIYQMADFCTEERDEKTSTALKGKLQKKWKIENAMTGRVTKLNNKMEEVEDELKKLTPQRDNLEGIAEKSNRQERELEKIQNRIDTLEGKLQNQQADLEDAQDAVSSALEEDEEYQALRKMVDVVFSGIFSTWRSVTFGRNVETFRTRYASLVELFMNFVGPYVDRIVALERRYMMKQ